MIPDLGESQQVRSDTTQQAVHRLGLPLRSLFLQHNPAFGRLLPCQLGFGKQSHDAALFRVVC